MEAIAESVRDYEYFAMLRDAIEVAGNKTDSTVIAKARKLLTDGPARVLNADGVDKVEWKEHKDRSVADQVRVEVLNMIIRFQ